MSRHIVGVALFAITLGAAGMIQAQDSPAAVLTYPYIITDPAAGLDTLVQLTNVSDSTVDAFCFYEDLSLECVAGSPGESCGPGPNTCSGQCFDEMARYNFGVRLTPKQPVAWRVSQGLSNAPLDGVERVGPNGANNQGTSVPDLGSTAMIGTLRCNVLGADVFRPATDNVLVGLATVESRVLGTADARQYRAIGFRALGGEPGPNRDEFLQLGGPEAEYESCPALIVLEHFFDGGPLRTGDQTAHVEPGIALATCTSPYGDRGSSVAQFMVYNEFDQRFSTSRAIAGQTVSRLALLDTTQPERSIFAVGVGGTLTGQTVIRGHGAGLVAIGTERHVYAEDRVRSAAYNVHGLSTREEGDFVAYRPARCIGDCDVNGSVQVHELVMGVNIALARSEVDNCEAMDDNGDLSVRVNELVTATNALLEGCPASVLPSAIPAAAIVSAQGTAQGTAAGPEITVFGLTTADDRPLDPNATDDEGRPIFMRPFGQGMTILIEARSGPNRRLVGRTTYNEGGLLPDLQLIVSNPLGNGDAAVCETDGMSGGVPGNAELDFDAPGATAAINDLGCRAFDRSAQPGNGAFSKPVGAPDVWHRIDSRSELQFGVPIAKAWAFPLGDTIVAARVRDVSGNLSAVREMVVRVTEP